MVRHDQLVVILAHAASQRGPVRKQHDVLQLIAMTNHINSRSQY